MKVRFISLLFILVAVMMMQEAALACEECSQEETAEIMKSEYVVIHDFTFGGTLESTRNLGAFLEREMHKFIERKSAAGDMIFIRSLEVDKLYKSFVFQVGIIELPSESKKKLCISETIKHLKEYYDDMERSYRTQGGCLMYFFQDLEKSVIIMIYQRCGWEV